MSVPAIYELNTVCKRHSDAFALQIDKLTIALGETFCVVGPTGAGKSTLLRLLSGLEPPTSGRMSLFGQLFEAQASLETQRRIATVHQRPLLLSESVRYNLEYGLNVRGVGLVSVRSDAMLAALGLSHLAEQDARTLSGGQLQLVAIGRALVIEPEVLLLDEPTAHLDPANVALVEDLIHARRQQPGLTVVWATHNLFQARRMASRVGLLLGGRLMEVANTTTFFANPTDERTAQFVQGKMVY